jgi:hypothetical protein
LALLIIGCGNNPPATMPKMADAGTVGAACTADTDCTQMGASCILPGTNSNWPGGYCTVKGCPTTACPDGTDCQQGATGLGAFTCFFKCSSDADCRSGYKCCEITKPSGTGVKVCAGAGVLCS